MARLYLMLGYPGAGKTTAANVISQLTGATHLSSDILRATMFNPPQFSQQEHDSLYDTLDRQTERFLREGKDVIYDANLNRKQHRQDKYEICQRTGSIPVLLWVQTPKNLAKDRALDINRSQLIPRDETADQMFDRIVSIIEEPSNDEPYTSIDGTKIKPKYIRQLLNL